MIIYLPCKLGKKFTKLKFEDWTDGKRTYKEDKERTLRGFSAFECSTRCLTIPIIYTDKEYVCYDPLGEYGQEYTPKYKISVDVKTEYKLSVKGFPSGQTGRLCGIVLQGKYLLADFVTNDRYEHLRFVIKDNLKYAELDEEPIESVIEYAPELQEEKRNREQEGKQNAKTLKQIKKKAAEPQKKGVNLKELIRTRAKHTEVKNE